MALISEIDRKRIGGQLSRWRHLVETGSFGRMRHEEAYDYVYGTTMHPDHKRDRLDRIERIVGK